MTHLPPPPSMPPVPATPAGGPVTTEHGPYSFVDAIKIGFKKFATFKGRARRSEFWYWQLFTVLVSSVIGGPMSFLANASWTGNATGGVDTLSRVVSLVLFLPSLAVGVRRLHDVGFSGAWLIAPTVCWLIGIVSVLIFGFAALFNGGDFSTTTTGVGAGLIAGVVLLVIGFGLTIPIVVFWSRDGGPNTPNKYGVRD